MISSTVHQRQGTYQSRDQRRLFYREFGDPMAERLPVLCLPGFTRNSKDFVELATRLSEHRRVLCPDLRGRGQSDYDPDVDRYHAQIYLEDIWELLAVTGVQRAVVIGTSLGGLLAMMMAATRPQAVAGVVLNDVGPEIAPQGLARICEYIGRLPEVRTWSEALAQSKAVYELALPNLTDAEWEQFTKRQYAEDAYGVVRREYDSRLGDALRRLGSASGDAWELFAALKEVPTLAFRGAISDILSPSVFDKMALVKTDLMRVVVPNRGHVPLLNEPECRVAFEKFFASL
ncbi:MAG: alpha/beta hydrolase [Gammaproteobacteria bacterium]|jgi:pimeloyl-ACP methyl ester carboxylesterase